MNLGKTFKAGMAVLSLVGTGAFAYNEVADLITTQTTQQEIVVEETNIEYQYVINTTNKYIVNGVEVSVEEFNELKEKGNVVVEDLQIPLTTSTTTIETTSETIEVTFTDFPTTSELVDLHEYLNWDANSVSAEKVMEVRYEYSDMVMSYVNDGKFESIGYAAAPYQIVEEGMTFTIDYFGTENGLIQYNIITQTQINPNEYVFKLVNNSNYKDLEFSDIFKSITLIIEK